MKKIVAAALAAGSLAVAVPQAAPAKDKFCTGVAEFKQSLAGLDKLAEGDFAGAAKQFATATKKMKDLEGKAPSKIKSDWKAMSTALGKMNTAIQKLKNVTMANAQKELAKVGPEIDKITADKSLDKAGDNISAWAKKECNIDLDS